MKLIIQVITLFSLFITPTFASGQSDSKPEYISDEVLQIVTELAQTGSAKHQFHLGLAYYYGVHLPKDMSKGYKWVRLAAEQDHIDAQAILAGMHHQGHGTAQDYVKSVKWWRSAAESGDSGSMTMLAESYIAGEGVPQDYVTAHMWANLAVARGESPRRRQALANAMTKEQIAEAQKMAREWESDK